MKFDSKLVKTKLAVFDPGPHLRSWGPLGESVTHPNYKKLVKAHEGHLHAMQDFSETKLGKETMETKKTTDEAAKKASQHYRDKMSNERKKASDEVKKTEDVTPTVANVKVK